MGYHDVLRQDVAVWYELGLTDAGDLRLRIDRLTWERMRDKNLFSEQAVATREVGSSMKLPVGIGPGDKPWGYGPVLQPPTLISDHSVEIVCSWPAIWNRKLHGPDWNLSFATSATLRSLFAFLLRYDQPGAMMGKQLIVIDGWGTEIGMSGCALTAMFSPALVTWLRDHEHNLDYQPIERAMYRTYRRLWSSREFSSSPREFRARVFNAGLHLDCPGNACGLDADDINERVAEGEGYRLLPHNTDSPLQQFTLLAGLAAVHGLARKAGL